METPITEKQKNFLKRNGYPGSLEEITKEEARILIKEAIEKFKNKD